jgi:hypothetical protein
MADEPCDRETAMTTPESMTPAWTVVEQDLRSRQSARCSLAIMLVALGVLGGIGLGIPIGRGQQARVDAQPVGFEEAQGWRPAGDRSDSMTLRLLAPVRRGAHPRGIIDL